MFTINSLTTITIELGQGWISFDTLSALDFDALDFDLYKLIDDWLARNLLCNLPSALDFEQYKLLDYS